LQVAERPVEMRVAQFVTILPPKEVLLEIPEEDLQEQYKKQFGESLEVYAGDTLRMDGKAVRIQVVEKEK